MYIYIWKKAKTLTPSRVHMRKIIDAQLKIGTVDISEIKIASSSRDEIHQILRGLQEIYSHKPTLSEIIEVLLEASPGVNMETGRRGMDLWNILVLSMLRLSCNWDYDKLSTMAENHILIRQFLGHGIFDTTVRYPRQTLRDNLWWFDRKVYDRISEIAVKRALGHTEELEIHTKRSKGISDTTIHGRCDSFVFETNIHYPTELNLLRDSLRKVVTLTGRYCKLHGIAGWSDYKEERTVIRGQCRQTEQLMRYRPKGGSEEDTEGVRFIKKRKELFDNAQRYLDHARDIILRSRLTLPAVEKGVDTLSEKTAHRIKKYLWYAEKFTDQVTRRVFHGESIPHEEKVFSIFEEYTELIRKGKVAVPQEFGIRVCVMEESKYGFILHHQVMERQEDDKVAVSMVAESQQKFEALRSCSFDTGFYTPDNLEHLKSCLDLCVMPTRGSVRSEHEESTPYKQLRKKHSGVESAIHALENHGLDICPDDGIEGFKRYVSIAVLARNIQIYGALLLAQEQEEIKKRRKRLRIKKAA